MGLTPPSPDHTVSWSTVSITEKTTTIDYSFLLSFLLVLYEVAFYDMTIATVIKLSVGFMFLILIAIGFAASTQVRCIVILVIPVFLGKEGRSMMSAAAVQYLVKGQ